MAIIEKAIPFVGGGYPNYTVIHSTTEPSSAAADNTIWVNTSTPIHYHEFSMEQPYRKSNNKNLNVYPYYHTTQTTNGITFTDNKDGSVTASGTSTAVTYFRCSHTDTAFMYLTAGTYTLSGCTGGSSSTYQIELGYSYDKINYTWITCRNAATTFTLSKDAVARINIKVASGVTLSNVKFYPQLEKGSSATSFVKGDATGQVWFSLGYNSNGAFSIIKGNGLKVYPVGCKQYNGSSWVSKASMIYQYGDWRKYVNSTRIVPNTTDYPSSKFTRILRASDNTTAATACSNLTEFTVDSSKLWVYHGTKNSIMSGYYTPIDVSGYNKMTIKATTKVSNSSKHYIGLFKSYDHINYNTMLAGYTGAGSNATINTTYDISSIAGNVYLMVVAYTTSGSNSYPETTVTSIVLEP